MHFYGFSYKGKLYIKSKTQSGNVIQMSLPIYADIKEEENE